MVDWWWEKDIKQAATDNRNQRLGLGLAEILNCEFKTRTTTSDPTILIFSEDDDDNGEAEGGDHGSGDDEDDDVDDG